VVCTPPRRAIDSRFWRSPYENEAVVAAAIHRFGGKVVVVDASASLPRLRRRPGLKTWKVRDHKPPEGCSGWCLLRYLIDKSSWSWEI
jgi:hypothetical protein